MLPSRLFRNTGIPPALRSLITPHSSLPPNISVQLRFRLGLLARQAGYSTGTPKGLNSTISETSSAGPPESLSSSVSAPSLSPANTSSQLSFEPPAPRLQMTFTCTVENCGKRSTHQFTKQAYEKGIVLIQCPGCHNRHLIADHLGWFKESTEEGKLRTVEDLLRARGESVTRGRLDAGGVVEYSE